MGLLSVPTDTVVGRPTRGFARLFSAARCRLVDMGLIHWRQAQRCGNPREARAALPNDVVVMTTRVDEREQKYWRSTTPAGFIFKTVLIVGLIGAV